MDLRSNNKIKVEGGMASMTDLVFLLLIFFIIMSLMSNNNMTVDVPKDTNELQPNPDPLDVSVVITEENGYIVTPGGDISSPSASFEDIVPALDAAMAASPKLTLRIEGHRLADYEAVFKVMAYADRQQWKPALAYKK
jgi:biopolymer transport protein ExbD